MMMYEYFQIAATVYHLGGIVTETIVTKARSTREAEKNARWRLVNKKNPNRKYKDGILHVNKVGIFDPY